VLNEYYFNNNKYNNFLINLEKLYVENQDFKYDNIFYTNTAVKAMLNDPKTEEISKYFKLKIITNNDFVKM
jgi:hypothetical protein